MSASKKLTSTLANAAAGGGLNVEDVFSTYLYTGNGSTQTITNGIDLDGEGGMVWVKGRDTTYDHRLFDTERGAGEMLSSNNTGAEQTLTEQLEAFNPDGFQVGNNAGINGSGSTYASWTFRKAPKFFDVVTYTGDGTNGRQIPHNLGSNIGMVICKGVDVSSTWAVKHKDRPSDEGQLNSTNAFAGYGNFPTSFAGFTDSYFTVDAGGSTNGNGNPYVAYLFAHNDGDGEFGEDADQDIIKCGSYTGTGGAGTPPVIDLGFEPQWLLVRNATSGGNWFLIDTMRGWGADGSDNGPKELRPDSSNAELDWGIYNYDLWTVNPTGFTVGPTHLYNVNNYSGDTYIYIAIRRPMKTPESGTEVFAVDNAPGTAASPSFISNFPVDMAFQMDTTGGDWWASSRLTGASFLKTNGTDAETSFSPIKHDYQNGYYSGTRDSTAFAWMFKRSPGFFDVMTWSVGSSFEIVSHNLEVTPELVIVKSRTNYQDWVVAYDFHSSSKYNKKSLRLNTTAAAINETTASAHVYAYRTSLRFYYGGRSPTFTGDMVAYLFASLDGISKVGSYTGNGTSQTIDCGFSTGARFVLIKRTDSSGDWHIWDTERGIVAGNDPFLELNTTNAENTSYDSIDPDSSGFIVNEDAGTAINTNSGTYLFYAIA